MRNVLLMSAAACGLAACADPIAEAFVPTTSPASSAWLSIVDRELVREDVTAMIRSDGTITGPGIAGVWAEREGFFCRTLTEPAQYAGTGCLSVTLAGNLVTFDTQGAGSSTWTVQ